MEEDLLRELKKISFASFVFHLRASTELHLPPYKGSTLRGAFGIVFKDTVCVVEHRDCDRCILRQKCAYPYIFDTPVPDGSARMRKYQRAPHPFVIEPPLDTRTTYKPGSSLSFGLTLIGKAIDYLPYFIYTFQRLGESWGIGRGRGRFQIKQVAWLGPEGEEKAIYDGEEKILTNSFHPLSLSQVSVSPASLSPFSVSVRFLTPSRITYNGHLHGVPEFHVIVRSLLRRLSNLCYFHCGQELRLDFKEIIERSEQIQIRDRDVRWHDWERYSARQDTRMKIGGFVGRVAYRGQLGEFLPILRLGEKIHLGKGTGFGLGKFVIVDYNHEQRARVTNTK